jgi:hypothetical protein
MIDPNKLRDIFGPRSRLDTLSVDDLPFDYGLKSGIRVYLRRLNTFFTVTLASFFVCLVLARAFVSPAKLTPAWAQNSKLISGFGFAAQMFLAFFFVYIVFEEYPLILAKLKWRTFMHKPKKDRHFLLDDAAVLAMFSSAVFAAGFAGERHLFFLFLSALALRVYERFSLLRIQRSIETSSRKQE